MLRKLSQIIFLIIITCFSFEIFASDSDMKSSADGGIYIVLPENNLSFAPFSFTLSKKDPLCYNSSDGMAWVTSITGGTPPFSYEWLTEAGFPIPGETNDTISGLPAGIYFCRITDNDGTKRSRQIELINPAVIIYDEIIAENVTCNGNNDGAITITAVGGTGVLEYSIDNGLNYQTGSIFTDLGPGNYNIIIKDENNCSKAYDFNPVTINEPGALTITLDDFGNLTCYGSGDGYINITPAGGTLPYIYNWTGPDSYTSGSEDLINLAAGSYNLILNDANNCSENLGPVILTQPDQFAIIVDNVQNITCAGANDGVISITVSGGTLPYNYLWTGPGSYSSIMEDISGLGPGNYTLRITDAVGCIYNYGPIILTEPPLLTATLDNIINVTCAGSNNGAIYVTIGGGTTPLVISWTGPSGFTSSSEDLVNIIAGNYTLLVTDANGCTRTLGPLTVTEPPPIGIVTDSKNNISCYGGNDGSIYVSVTGGTLPYRYFWSGPGSFSSSNEDITGLYAGNYKLTVRDGKNCIKKHTPVILTQPTKLNISIDYINHITCFGDNNGSIGVTATGGIPPYTYLWTGPGSYTSSNADISNLAPGTYNLTVRDFNGCSTNSVPININEPPVLSLVTDTVSNLSCWAKDDGAIYVTVTGGTPTYSYSWTGPGSFVSTSEDITGLEPGNYNLTITDANSCIFTPGPISISEPAEIIVTTDLISDITCNGGNDGVIQVSVSGGTPPFTYNWTSPGTFTSSDEDITNLFAGNYNLTVLDISGCTGMHGPITVNEPPVLNAVIDSIINVTCNGGNDGAIYVTVTGGILPYIYSWTGSATYSDEDITNLEPGTYDLEITDANGCKFNISSVIVTEPSPFSFIVDSIIDNSCFGSNNGDIYVTVSGGTLPYNYLWTGPGGFSSGIEDISGLIAGDYTLSITDGHNCPGSFPAQSVQEPVPISVTVDPASKLTIDCFGDGDGSIYITASGGTGTYSYSWTGPDGYTSSNEDINGLSSGDYDLLVTDANGCIKDTSVFINSPPELVIDTLYIGHITGCYGDNTGTINLTASGGTGILEYSLDGAPFVINGDFSNLTGGNHLITIRDDNNCEKDTNVFLIQPDTIGISSITVLPVICYGDSNGSIIISGSGGTLPYSYTLTPGPVTNNTGIFAGLAPGTYNVTVDDANGCPSYTTSALLVVEAATPFVIDSTKSVNISSFGMNDGQISIYVSGGISPYLYSIDNGITFDSLITHTGLSPAEYITFVKDAAGCILPGDTILLTQPTEIIIDNESFTDVVTCFGDSSGSVNVIASGGAGTLQYSIDSINWQDSGTFINLPGGSYQVTVIDTAGNKVKSNILLIAQPEKIIADISLVNPSPWGLGLIYISASGGTGALEYSINGISGPYQSDTAFMDLLPGDYWIVVRDENSCLFEDTVTLEGYLLLEVDVSYNSILCNGDSTGFINLNAVNGSGVVQYSIDDGLTFQTNGTYENLLAGKYPVFVTDDEGKAYRDTVSIIQPDTISVIADIVPATCNNNTSDGSINLSVTGGTPAYTFNWSNDSVSSDISSLNPGLYSITITDQNNCTYQNTYEVTANILVNANAGNDTIVCTGQQVILEGSGGVNYSWLPVTQLSNPLVPNPVATVVSEIEYILTVTEPGGCYDMDTVVLGTYPTLGIDAGMDTTVATGQALELSAAGGPFNEYSWIPQEGLDNPSSQSPILQVTDDMIYYVTGTTANGCFESDSIIITTVKNLVIYSGFTPNGDNINDFWDIDNAAFYPDISVEVFNRWGGLVFSSKGYSSEQRWDGTYNGKDVSIGTYWYVINLNDGSNAITGHVTIVR